MSMSSSPSDVDDIIVGKDFAIVAKGGRRWMFGGLSRDQLRQLSDSRSAGSMLRALAERQEIDFGHRREARPLKMLLSSRIMTMLAKPASGLTFPAALGLMTLAAVGVGAYIATAASPNESSYVAIGVSTNVLMVCTTFVLSFCVHELGHAAACVRATSATGGLRGHISPGGLQLAVDVSSQVRANRSGKLTIALAGPVFQIAFAAGAGLTGMLAALSTLVPTAGAVALVAIANLVPVGSNDGAVALDLISDRSSRALTAGRIPARIFAIVRGVVLVTAFAFVGSALFAALGLRGSL